MKAKTEYRFPYEPHSTECDLCKKSIDLLEGIACGNLKGDWQLICCECDCNDAVDKYPYPLPLDRFFTNPDATLAWIYHLSGKGWIDGDKFFKFLQRIAVNASCFNTY